MAVIVCSFRERRAIRSSLAFDMLSIVDELGIKTDDSISVCCGPFRQRNIATFITQE